jgi:hypothetical protein
VLSCVSRGLCDGLITRPKESYQVSKIDYETSRVRRPRSTRTVEPLMMMMMSMTNGAGRPLHRDHFLVYCAFPILSTPPVVPYLLRRTVSCITKCYHARLVPCNVYPCNKVFIQQSPLTHTGRCTAVTAWVSLHAPVAVCPWHRLAHPSCLPSSWYFQTNWTSTGEACLP